MTLARSLLGSAAALCCATAGAQAADLPVRKAAPVEYVRVCTAYGAGFFYIPGTDTCLRVGGRVRFTYQYMSSRANGNDIIGRSGGIVGRDNSAFQSLTNLNFDARTQTGYGTLRTFIRVLAAYNSGGQITSGTNQRFGYAYPALGQDTFGRAQSNIYLDKAFVQFAGFTAGRASSFFDFYAHDLEFFGATSGSNSPSTNLLAYTATFGGGFSATIAIEDPIARRQPVFADNVFATATGVPGAISGGPSFTQLGGLFTQSVIYRVPVSAANPFGLRAANFDVQQRELVPDVVAALRYDASWGSAQVSAALHELRPGYLVSTAPITGFSGTSGAPTQGTPVQGLANAAGAPALRVKEELGWAVQGGLKINLPQIATGDVLWLQAAYSEGALSYAGHPARLVGSESLSNQYSGRFAVSTVDSFVGADGKQKLTESWSVTAAYLHYWVPEWRSAFFGSYAEVDFGRGARSGAGPGGFFNNGSTLATNTIGFSSTLRDYSVAVVGANLIWSPVKNLDIGLEGIYTRVDLKNGRAVDLTGGSTTLTGLGLGVPVKTAKTEDLWAMRFRVQRDF